MRLFLIRHGQTIGNVRGALDTQLPGPPLTELGQEQANALVDTLREEPIVAVYASQAVRARQTAAPLAAALGHEVQVIDGVKEVAAGELEGATDPESTHLYLQVAHSWLQGDLGVRMPGGESGEEVQSRMLTAIGDLRAKHEETDPEGIIVLVSHGAAMRLTGEWLAANVRPEIADKGFIPNTGIIVFETVADGGWHCHSWAGLPLD
ncbi:histidine phosphatase family protein [Amycolatopsis sp. NPDC059657]|uniref:histidine phosphatase family protein n=1 Tax=Amycolatopsis sp. NPDC059657 TaxID=3346899 RepID=UPI00367032BF